jgi:hypothetical protein
MDLKIEYIFNKKRNKQCILIENYIFRRSYHFKNGSFRFLCTNRRYLDIPSVLVNPTIDKILSFSNNNKYNHEPNADHDLAVQCVRIEPPSKGNKVAHTHYNVLKSIVPANTC